MGTRIEIKTQPMITSIPSATTAASPRHNSLWDESYKRLKKNKAAIVSAYFILFVIGVAIFAQFLAPYAFDAQNVERILLSPNSQNWLGTDSLGRDIFSRLIFGSRISIAVGIFTAVVSLLMGTFYGACSGWFGGKIDSLMMRLVDILYSIPALVLLVLAKVTIESLETFKDPELRALFSIFGALSIYGWMGMARIVRGQVLQAKQMQYIEAARSLGISSSSIVMRHILPNILGPIIVTLTFQIPATVAAGTYDLKMVTPDGTSTVVCKITAASPELDVADYVKSMNGTAITYPYTLTWGDDGRFNITQDIMTKMGIKVGSVLRFYKKTATQGQVQINNGAWKAYTVLTDWNGTESVLSITIDKACMDFINQSPGIVIQGGLGDISKITVQP